MNKHIARSLPFVVGACLVCTSAGTSAAQDRIPSDSALAALDDSISNMMERGQIPGVVYAVSSNGQVVHAQAYGLADLELHVPMILESAVEIGSISKQFTATGIMLLVQEGKLGLDDPIELYIDILPERWHGITVRQLLTHTSGIPDYEAIFGYESYRNIYTPREIIDIGNSQPPDFPPGTDYSYSNTGYFLLTMILERVSGEKFEEFLQARIFGPLGMTATRNSDPSAIIPNRASGYWLNDGDLENRDPIQPSSTGGAGTIVSTVLDMAKWDAALYTDQVLPQASLDTMWTPATLVDGSRTNYGFGWSVSPYRGHRRQSHSGQTAGYLTSFVRFPDDSLAIMVFSNRYQARLFPIVTRVMHTFLPELAYASLQPASDVDPEVVEAARLALREIAGAEESTGALTEKLAEFVDGPDFAGSRENVRAWVNDLNRFEFLRIREMPEGTTSDFGEPIAVTYLYRMVAGDTVRYWNLWVTPNGKVADFGVVAD